MILFLKAQPGLFPDLVRVTGHARADGTYVRPYQARRLRAEAVDQPELAPVAAQDAYTGEWGPRCPFCGDHQRLEIGEMWTDHNFTLDTCCPELHDETTRAMAEDPEYAARLLRQMGAEDLAGRELRRVAFTDEGFGPVLLDWQPEVRQISRAEAMDFIAQHHRHNPPLPGDVFRAGAFNGHTLMGVVVVGFPTARALMDGFKQKDVIEVRRLAVRTDLGPELSWKVASALYSHAADEAARRGYRKIITYTLRDSESGMSLRYARWKPEAETRGGRTWDTPSRPREQKAPTEAKVRWFKRLQAPAEMTKAMVPGHTRQHGSIFVRPYTRKTPPMHGAPPVMSFRSGASRPADFRGYAAAGAPIGVALSEFSPNGQTWPMLTEYARRGGHVFVDSGAFGDFQAKRQTDFDMVMGRMLRLAEEAKGGRLHLVMPDVVADQAGSLRVLAEHAPAVHQVIALGHDALVPIHKGEMPPYDAWRAAAQVLGTDDFTVAIPAVEQAFTADDLANLFDGPMKPARVHLLGVAGDKARLGALVRAIHQRSPGTVITSDANRLRAKIGEGRPVTKEAERAKERLAQEKWGSSHPALRKFDLTELIGQVALDPGWMTDDQVRELARDLGVRDPAELDRWVEAHREEGLSDLLDEQDGDGRMTEMAVRRMFDGLAARAVSSTARSEAIATVEQREDAQRDLFGAAAQRKPRRLLVIACSKKKDGAPGAIPAVDRYRPGALFQMLHKVPKEQRPDVVILSAKHGFIPGDQPIEDYDQEMNADRQREMLADPGVVGRLADLAHGKGYDDVLVAAGEHYRPVIAAALHAANLSGAARFTGGRGIGDHRSQLEQWLAT